LKITLAPEGASLLEWCVAVEELLIHGGGDSGSGARLEQRVDELEKKLVNQEQNQNVHAKRLDAAETNIDNKLDIITFNKTLNEWERRLGGLSAPNDDRKLQRLEHLLSKVEQELDVNRDNLKRRADEHNKMAKKVNDFMISNLDSDAIMENMGKLQTIVERNSVGIARHSRQMQEMDDIITRLEVEENHTRNFIDIFPVLEHNDEALLERVKKQEQIIHEQQTVIERLTQRLVNPMAKR